MNNHNIKDALSALAENCYLLEQAYTENGGEVTDETLSLESNIDYLKELLLQDGVDSLGRWLKAKEDEVKTYKAEKDAAARKIKSCENTIDYIKSMVHQVLTAAEVDKVKGSFYSFTPYEKVSTSADKERINELYNDKVAEALKELGIPTYITFSLGASVNLVQDENLPDVFVRTTSHSCKFTKPRANKE